MQEIAHAASKIKYCRAVVTTACDVVFVTDINLFDLVVNPWHETFFMLVVTEIVLGFVIIANYGFIRSWCGEKQFAVVAWAVGG